MMRKWYSDTNEKRTYLEVTIITRIKDVSRPSLIPILLQLIIECTFYASDLTYSFNNVKMVYITFLCYQFPIL